MTIDRSLNWDEHINNLRTKVSRAIGFLKYSRNFLPQNTLSEICRGIVDPFSVLLFGMGLLWVD